MVVSEKYNLIAMQILLKAVRWTSLVSFPVFLLATPNSPALAGSIGTCANSLISSGVAQLSAASACSDALEPTDLATCVTEITATGIKGDEAIQACYRVRRPDELASCVTTINSSLAPGKEQSAVALDSCSRSLLPERHAECTLDIAAVSKISSEEAMKSCLAAEINPGQVSPTTKTNSK
jgi:hypothetical protein